MKLKTKIWLALIALICVVMAVDLAVSYQKLSTELHKEAEYDARTVYGFMMATRRVYQQQFIFSGLPANEKTIGFLPAHSFSRISQDFHNWNKGGIIFNNVSDVPRNPRNQADRFELDAMAWFRANPKASELSRNIVNEQGVGYLLYTAPIYIEPLCLKCHGKREEAPPSIRDTYAGAYGYKLGDLRGLVSIKIPTAKLQNRLYQIWGGQVLKSLIGYTLLLAAVGLILERLVTRRLAILEQGAKKIAAGDYSTRVAQTNQDEICGLAASFNDMAAQVQDRDRTLNKLYQAVEQSFESVIITDLNAHIEYVNQAFVNNSGYSREEAVGENPRFLQSGKTPQASYDSLWDALKQGQVWQGQFINRRKDGSEHIESAIISPVRAADGRVTNYLAVKQDITERTHAEAQIHNLAYYDALTGLPNRALLMDRLAQLLAAARRGQHMEALILLNLDRFKTINDARGHAMGDALLKALGERIGGLLREVDTLARMASDEFALLLPNLSPRPEHASRHGLAVAEKIHGALLQPFIIQGEEVTLTASLAITLFPEEPDEVAEVILRRADTALHRAKAAGGNQTAFFETGMGETAEQRFRIERELRRAIPAGELRLFLQPQVDAHGQMVGAEALVRWQHPERGLLPPAVFITIAEESDLIVELGAWVLSETCRLLAREDIAGRPLKLSANLSPRQFRRANFVPWLRDVLERTGADASHLTLEVTEGLMIDNLNEVVAKMSELTTLGLHFSVDDFGTGYSSLSYIKRLPIHELKIDKSFVQDAPTNPDDAALVETILAVARHMHLKVVAEGVETQGQADFLNARANIIHQGYLYGRPEPAEAWLAHWKNSV